MNNIEAAAQVTELSPLEFTRPTNPTSCAYIQALARATDRLENMFRGKDVGIRHFARSEYGKMPNTGSIDGNSAMELLSFITPPAE